MTAAVITWFRNDLRLGDNAALHATAASELPVIPLSSSSMMKQPAPGAMGLETALKSDLEKSDIALHHETVAKRPFPADRGTI